MNCNDHYIPVAFARALVVDKPLRTMLQGKPVVVWRTGNGLRAYHDVCPHRGAMLSAGRVVNGELECPYHGWRFNSAGANTIVPVKNTHVNCALKPVAIKEAYDLVWIGMNEDDALPALYEAPARMTFSGSMQAKPENALENFLEGSHTHFVHNGLIRSSGKQRQQIIAELVPNDRGFRVTYEQEAAKGLLTRLLPPRFRSLKPVSTFISPNTAILEYFGSNDELIARFESVITPAGGGIHYFARAFLNIGLLSPLGRLAGQPFFARVIAQDKHILEQQERNISLLKDVKFYSDETDTVGREIFAWLHNPAATARQPLRFTLYW